MSESVHRHTDFGAFGFTVTQLYCFILSQTEHNVNSLTGYNTRMASTQPQPAKPAMPASWQWLLRLTGIFALLLFLTPTFYVIKYYSLDLPREQAKVKSVSASDYNFAGNKNLTADDLPALTKILHNEQDWEARKEAVGGLKTVLLQPGIGWKRPLECLSAKAALAEVAAKDTNPTIRQEASAALASVAQGGVTRR